MPVWWGSPVVGKTNIHAQFSLNSTNNLNYKGTSSEFIAGERNNNKKSRSMLNRIYKLQFCQIYNISTYIITIWYLIWTLLVSLFISMVRMLEIVLLAKVAGQVWNVEQITTATPIVSVNMLFQCDAPIVRSRFKVVKESRWTKKDINNTFFSITSCYWKFFFLNQYNLFSVCNRYQYDVYLSLSIYTYIYLYLWRTLKCIIKHSYK
jgi:hypothetical protein